MPNTTAEDAPRLVDAEEAAHITGVKSKGTRNKMIREGSFPRPIAINARQRLWVESELFAWVNEQRENRDNGIVPEAEQKMRQVRSDQAVRGAEASIAAQHKQTLKRT
jgi:predicted DNA-binding transcriptional regulator AlpA